MFDFSYTQRISNHIKKRKIIFSAGESSGNLAVKNRIFERKRKFIKQNRSKGKSKCFTKFVVVVYVAEKSPRCQFWSAWSFMKKTNSFSLSRTYFSCCCVTKNWREFCQKNKWSFVSFRPLDAAPCKESEVLRHFPSILCVVSTNKVMNLFQIFILKWLVLRLAVASDKKIP